MLISAKSSLEHLDNEANTVFHYAAGTNKDIIMVTTIFYELSFKIL